MEGYSSLSLLDDVNVDKGAYFSCTKDEFHEGNAWYSAKVQQWRNENKIRIVERKVPDSILPSGTEGVLADLSPNVKGEDEIFFRNDEDIRRHLPRGAAILQLHRTFDQLSECDTVIYANRKFFEYNEPGSCSNTFSVTPIPPGHYFISSPSFASNVIATEKVNGEAAHFSGRVIGKEFYFIAGSKKVHLLFREKEHIELYTEKRYTMAREVAHAVWDQWNKMTEENRSKLADFLHQSRVTVVCEIKMPHHQHVVDFSNLSDNSLVVLAVTGQPSPNLRSHTAMPSEKTFQMFAGLGFQTAAFETLSSTEVRQHANQIRRAQNTEGVVYYYEDSCGNTLGLVKLKTVWYIHLRALRQQGAFRHTANNSNLKTVEDCKKRSRRRLDELRDWLLTTGEELEAWKRLSDEWLEWLEEEVKSGATNHSQIQENFATVWSRFQQQSNSLNFLDQEPY